MIKKMAIKSAAWFFAIDVFAGSSRHDRCWSVPPITSSNHDSVDIFAIEQFPEIAIKHTRITPVVFINKLLAFGAPACLDVCNGNALHIGQSQHCFEVVGATRTDSNDAQSDPFTGRYHAITA